MDNNSYIITPGVVVSNIDPYGGNRIQVRMGNIHDGTKNNEELIYCTPLMPKLIHIIPKPNELVLIILQKAGASDGNRFYIGPVLSQPQRFYNELSTTAQSFLDNPNGTGNTTLENPNNGDNIGSIPDTSDIAIIGRDNCELVMKEHDMRLLCGYKGTNSSSVENIMKFNKVDPAFIQMQWQNRTDNNASVSGNKKYSSSINIYADRINLLSRQSDVNIGELDNTDLITEDKMNELLEKCHPLVYGDKLVEFLNTFRRAFTLHTHAFPMIQPVADANVVNLNTFTLEDMLSKSVKTC